LLRLFATFAPVRNLGLFCASWFHVPTVTVTNEEHYVAKNEGYVLTTGQVAAAVPCNRNTVITKELQGVVDSRRVGPNNARLFERDAPDLIRDSLARNRK
jgi:hypothetical protein